MKILSYILSICLIAIYLSSSAAANIIQAASCSRADVQAAINSAQDGDTVLVPAGECTWNSEVSIQNKTITLIGAGSDAGGTKIIYGGSNHGLLDIDAENKTGKMEVTGFWFYGGDSDYWSGTAISFGGPKGWKNLRIHHNVFENNKQWTMVGYAGSHGLIDNNTFKGEAHGIVFWGDDTEDWETPLYLGTADFFFVEDNLFDWDDWYGVTGAACMDMNSGGRVVFRHNTIKYGFWETHDKARHGTAASANAYEIYNNSFWTNTTKWKGLDISAGTGVVWGNNFIGGGTWETDWTVPIGAMDYKSFDPRGLLPCDGNDPADQNVPGEAGWRCQYQIGTQGEGATAYSYPLYVWSNYNNANLVGMECTAGCEVNGRPHLLEGRDFINNGTTPKPGYTPFTYPHPFRQNDPTFVEEDELIVKDFVLYQNYPNPFNPSTSLSFVIGQSSFVSLKVYDMLGNEIAALVNEEKPVGSYEVEFNANLLPSGIYFYQIKCGSFTQAKKMLLLK
jgi:hypothetical protein